MKASQFIEGISGLGFSVFLVAEASRILEKSSKCILCMFITLFNGLSVWEKYEA